MQDRKGFTLVELLAVISIVVILAALLMPALGAARQAAQTASCSSNLHQIGVAFELYSMDSGYLVSGGLRP